MVDSLQNHDRKFIFILAVSHLLTTGDEEEEAGAVVLAATTAELWVFIVFGVPSGLTDVGSLK